MDANRRIFERLRRLYTTLAAAGDVADYVSHGNHGDRPDTRQAAFRWMDLHLKQDSSPVSDATDPPIEGSMPRVFPEDQDRPADSRNATIDETFIAKPPFEPPAAAGFLEWKKGRLAAIRATSFRTFPDPIPAVARNRRAEP